MEFDLNFNPMRLLLFLIALSCISCNSYVTELEQVYNDKEQFLQQFKNVSVFRGRGNNFTLLHTYSGQKQNRYSFYKHESRYGFESEVILFTPDEVLNINRQDNPAYKRQLTQKLKSYLEKMDSLSISDVSSEFIPHGITLKVYMKSKAILVFVDDPASVTNPQWINYLKSMEKFNEHWYYAKQDH